MDAQQTLFSLELAVDSLCLVPHTVICRLPAVAFRLLDFPPLLIQQLDSDETKQLRQAMQSMWDDNVSIPNQLKELQNRHGSYEFKKGKSSLYNYELDLLETHLANTPLYVMILDVWNQEVPKLAGHCNISLKDVVSAVKRDVKELGISVPSVHGTQGKFPVYNLMGSEIGWISLGVRLLSLGGNLTPHIPVEAVSVRKGADHHVISVPLKESNLNVVQERIPIHEAKVEHQVMKGGEKTKGGENESDKNRTTNDKVSVSTETKSAQHESGRLPFSRVKSRTNTRTKSKQMAADFHEQTQTADDLFVTNVHVPPPLFFNSKNDIKEKHTKSGTAFKGSQYADLTNVRRHSQHANVQRNTKDISTSSLFEGSRELEVQYTIHPPEFHSSPNVRKILRKKGDYSRTEELSETDGGVNDKENAKTHVGSVDRHKADVTVRHAELEHVHHLPILNALLQELSFLHGGNIDSERLASHPSGHHDHLQHRIVRRDDKNWLPEEKKLETEHVVKKEGVIGHQTEQSITSKPPPPQKAYRHKHRECAQPPTGVPATKGWLRQEPLYGGAKSSSSKKPKQTKQLKFKMTNSQKLRLQRHNPEALRQVEEEEKIAEIEFQMRAAKMHMNAKNTPRGRGPKTSGKKRPTPAPGPRPSENLVHLPDTVVSTEISRHQDDGPEDLTPTLSDDGDLKRGAETFKIPGSDSVRNEQEHPEEQIPEVQDQLCVPSDTQNSDARDPFHQDLLGKDTSGSEKSVRSISVCLPSAVEQKADEGDDVEEGSSLDESQDEGPKVVPFPGFPAEDHLDEEMRDGVTPLPLPSSQGIYSEDFDDSSNFQSTGEQELASIQTSDRSARFSSDTSFNPNQDRAITTTPPVGSSRSRSSSESSYETAASVKSSGNRETKEKYHSPQSTELAKPSKSSSDSNSSTSSKHPTARLAIPQPQMSANSPVPLARRSAVKSVAFKQEENVYQPPSSKSKPEPKPRLSLEQTGSSLSDASLLAPDLTLSKESTDVNTFDLEPGYSDEDSVVDDVYSDDFDSGDN